MTDTLQSIQKGDIISNATQTPRLSELTKGFSSAMLVTLDDSDDLRARPMAVAGIDDPNVLWFATDANSGKIDELRSDSRVAVTFQGRARFLSIPGKAEVIIDADKIDELWKESWSLWFEEGRDDDIALVRVQADKAETWTTSGEDVASFLWSAGKAAVTGSKVDSSELGEHHTHQLATA